MDITTRDRLIQTSALLFRKKGFHGVGIAEILAATGLPKGSLYHHFPNGKQDLAIASAEWASAGMTRIINDAFEEASDFESGATTLCHKLAKFFDLSGGWDGCPVSNTLLDGPENEEFRSKVAEMFEGWIECASGHGVRLGLETSDARDQAELLLLAIQGAWSMARAKQSSEILRRLPERLY
jgi:TetR/AcrR family transcriptional repressor of lmrAB and yxaGH operons